MKTFSLFLKILLALASIFAVLALCYLLGWPVLEGYLKGNDIGFYLSNTDWLSRYLPFAPQWYPLAGGGVSLLQSMQMGAYWLSTIVSKVSSLSLGQTIRLIEFTSIFIVSLELYFIVWYFFKNQTTALLAALFFPLSQAVWSFVLDIGMLPQTTSFIFVLPAFLFFDLFLDKKQGRFLVLTVFSFSLAFLTHLITGVLLVEGFILYGFFRAFLLPKKAILKEVWSNLFWAVLIVILGMTLISFWVLPYLRYLSIASRNIVATLAFEQIGYVNLTHLFGFDKVIDPQEPNIMWEAFFALPVVILAFASLVLAVVKARRRKENRRVLLFGALFVTFLVYSALPGLAPSLAKLVMAPFVTVSYSRAFLVPMIIMPLLAAWACQALSKIILAPLRKFSRVTKLFLPILTLIVAFIFVLVFARAPSYYNQPCYQGLGMGTLDIDYCHPFGKLGQSKEISVEGTPWDELASTLAQKLNLSEKQRIDISPNWGPIIMNWPRFSSSSMVGLYSFVAGINNIFTGYFGGALWS